MFFDSYITVSSCKPKELFKYDKGQAWQSVRRSKLAMEWMLTKTRGIMVHQASLHLQLRQWLTKEGHSWAVVDSERAIYDFRRMIRLLVRTRRRDRMVPHKFNDLTSLLSLLPSATALLSQPCESGESEDQVEEEVQITPPKQPDPAKLALVAMEKPLVYVSSDEEVTCMVATSEAACSSAEADIDLDVLYDRLFCVFCPRKRLRCKSHVSSTGFVATAIVPREVGDDEWDSLFDAEDSKPAPLPRDYLKMSKATKDAKGKTKKKKKKKKKEVAKADEAEPEVEISEDLSEMSWMPARDVVDSTVHKYMASGIKDSTLRHRLRSIFWHKCKNASERDGLPKEECLRRARLVAKASVARWIELKAMI